MELSLPTVKTANSRGLFTETDWIKERILSSHRAMPSKYCTWNNNTPPKQTNKQTTCRGTLLAKQTNTIKMMCEALSHTPHTQEKKRTNNGPPAKLPWTVKIEAHKRKGAPKQGTTYTLDSMWKRTWSELVGSWSAPSSSSFEYNSRPSEELSQKTEEVADCWKGGVSQFGSHSTTCQPIKENIRQGLHSQETLGREQTTSQGYRVDRKSEALKCWSKTPRSELVCAIAFISVP
jgi:hypothetical protein